MSNTVKPVGRVVFERYDDEGVVRGVLHADFIASSQCVDGAPLFAESGAPYQYNRNQLKGLLMLAYGPIIPAPIANDYADRVLDLLDTNEEVQCLILSMEKMEGGKP